MAAKPPQRPLSARMLDAIERFGNAMPNPASLFFIMAGLVVIASTVLSALGVTVLHPKDGSVIHPVNLLTSEGIRRMLTESVKNFTGFAPLGIVLVTMLGVGLAEATGLLGVAIRAFALAIPRRALTASILFLGISAHHAADAGLIILPPIGAMLFVAAGRHPLAGLAAAFAGVAGGFSANVLPTTLDVLLAGFTQEAVNSSRLWPGYEVQILGNYWFMFAATPVLIVVGTWLTDKIVEPRLPRWTGGTEGALQPLSHEEQRGLRAAGLAVLASVAGVLLLVWPGIGPLYGEGRTLLERLKPFFDSMVPIVTLLFLVPGLAYGITVRKVRNDHDVVRLTSEAMATMTGYIVLAFACAQFVSYFAWSNLGAIVAISGAQGLRNMGLEGIPLLTAFVMFSALLNLMITSSSALWAIVGPIFVPMFGILGFTPEATQAVYRIGESCTNIVTPLLPYMPFILAAAQRYDPKAGTGTIVSLMLPYATFFLVFWTLLALLFYAMGWDIGPGVGMRLP